MNFFVYVALIVAVGILLRWMGQEDQENIK
jgi:hypothetical protein